jgi:hypothetical protein
MERCLCPWCSGPLWARLHMVRMCEEGRQGRGHQGGMQECLHRAGPLGVNLVQTVHRLIQLEAEFDLPAHTVEIGNLQRADPWRKIREEETVAFRGRDVIVQGVTR